MVRNVNVGDKFIPSHNIIPCKYYKIIWKQDNVTFINYLLLQKTEVKIFLVS